MKRRKTDLWAIAVYFCNGIQYNAYGLFDSFKKNNRRCCIARPFPDEQPTPPNVYALDRLLAKCENMTVSQIESIIESIPESIPE